MGKVIYENIDQYKNYGKAIKISNSNCEVIVTLDVGPRIMHFSKPGMDNILEDNVPNEVELPDGKKWNILGGHRVWHGPEAYPRSYQPDTDPLEKYEFLENGIIMVQKEERWTQMQKKIEVRLFDNHVKITNRITNKGAWAVEMSVWSLTVGSQGGREVCPVVQKNTGLLPNTRYAIWPYSSMNDSRVYWGEKYIVLDNDPKDRSAFKFGYPNEFGWAAYFNKGQCFIKEYKHDKEGEYPDMGSSWETYISDWGIELEAISPLRTIEPEEDHEITEEWFIYESKSVPERDEEEITQILTPIAKKSGVKLPEDSSKDWDPTV